MKKRLTITIDSETGSYELDTPDGSMPFDIMGQVIADMLVRFFDPDHPIEPDENGVINLNKQVDHEDEDIINVFRKEVDKKIIN